MFLSGPPPNPSAVFHLSRRRGLPKPGTIRGSSRPADGQNRPHETVQLLGRCRCLGLPRLPSRCERARGPLNHSGLRNGYLLGVRRSSNHTSDWVVIQSVAEE